MGSLFGLASLFVVPPQRVLVIFLQFLAMTLPLKKTLFRFILFQGKSRNREVKTASQWLVRQQPLIAKRVSVDQDMILKDV